MKEARMGCPFSHRARSFDPFGPEYQADPPGALAWSRAEEPVFYSEVLGYWVVSRYDLIKDIFRDPITFSPRNALEKITPPTPEALAVLKSYGFDLRRTLVNEDEPVHLERRRALIDAFAPERLAAHVPMVRRLVRERVDAIIDAGEADLVAALLWEVPFLVALHFLGVPEDDHAKLRAFSVAHTLNTWGRPTPEEQVELAHGVGRFWQYCGEVLERMKANPDGHGWMYDMIRANRVNPEVVTDNYLHSMLMAIIVAAHETTALAGGNMMRRLLEDRAAWATICAEPELIPNAVEECLRHSGSVVAWRRVATREVQVGGVTIPEGGRILMVTASANHDPAVFPDPDRLDLRRDNTAQHLTFGYGAHQCMGKNIARMELRIILEELSRRLPHMHLAPQTFTFLPNTSFRGPEHLHVRWDPAQNPERRDPAVREASRDFPIGAPERRALARRLVVAARTDLAEGVVGLTLADPSGAALPAWQAGAHVTLDLGAGLERAYSLCGRDGAWQIAVLREPQGRGGSAFVHDRLTEGVEVRVRGPRCHFRLDEGAAGHLLIAGGIGITPILAMADRLRALNRDFALHYAGRSRRRMAFIDRLLHDHGPRTRLHVSDEGTRLDLPALIAAARPGTQVCACGPARLLDALAQACAVRPDLTLTVEHFAAEASLDPAREHAFTVELLDSGLTLTVPPDRTLLQTLRAAGIDVPSDCEEGLCGTCEVAVAAGAIDHRDRALGAAEKARGDRMLACCSRARGDRLALRL
jgi:cytochrome P450/ferredoxin-NADP reductase